MSYRKKIINNSNNINYYCYNPCIHFLLQRKRSKRFENNIRNIKWYNQSRRSSGKFFENVEYRGIDANGNRYLLKSDFATFEKDKPELIKMAGMNAIFYFKDGKELECLR